MFTVCVLHGDVEEHPAAKVVADPLADADAYVVGPDCPYEDILAGDTFPTVRSAVESLVLDKVELVTACDACCKKVKASYATFPSARASQAIAKCRKAKGNVRKGPKGRSLKRWQREKWKDKVTGKPCGHDGGPEYCRPSKKVSSQTPKTPSKGALKTRINQKRSGQRASAV